MTDSYDHWYSVIEQLQEQNCIVRDCYDNLLRSTRKVIATAASTDAVAASDSKLELKEVLKELGDALSLLQHISHEVLMCAQ